jgi:alpha-tubulin suppressor-like RCC1 family protein
VTRLQTILIATVVVMACRSKTPKHDYDSGFAPEAIKPVTADGRDPSLIKQVVAGDQHTCALFADGDVRCWGQGGSGRLGTGSTNLIGDDESAAAGRNVVLGGPAEQLAAGSEHTCALMRTGTVRCWGEGDRGRLGYGNTNDIGLGELPADAGDVQLGETAAQVAAGGMTTCALLSSGAVRCWGNGADYRLGFGAKGPGRHDIGDDEVPMSVPALRFDAAIKQVASDGTTPCVLFEGGTVRCWGPTEGMPHDAEIQAAIERRNLDLGVTAIALGAGVMHMCAITTKANVRCWGASGGDDRLGYGAGSVAIGPNDARYPTPARLGDVPGVSNVVQVAGGDSHTCVLLSDGRVRCWGDARFGQAGCGKVVSGVISGKGAQDLKLPARARQIAAGRFHTCALLDDETVRCWGDAEHGQLGYGSKDTVWDAAQAPPVPL